VWSNLTFFQFDPTHRVHWKTGHLKCPNDYTHISFVFNHACRLKAFTFNKQLYVAVNVGHKSNYYSTLPLEKGQYQFITQRFESN
jgi:hypothetical protein